MYEDTQPAALGADGGLDPLAEFRIEHPREIAAVMRQLMDASAPVHLSTPDGTAMSTVVWTVDTAQRRLLLAADTMHPQLQPLAEASEVTAVSYLDAVKLQFDLADTMLVRGAQQCTLSAALPRELYRFQRRNTFRVRTLERSVPTARFRHPALPDMNLALRVLDVSIGGCALFLPEDVPPLQPGVDIQGTVIELDADTRFAATLRLHHVTVIQPSSRGSRLGCELMHMDGLAQRALQRYIDQTQKRRRMMSLS